MTFPRFLPLKPDRIHLTIFAALLWLGLVIINAGHPAGQFAWIAIVLFSTLYLMQKCDFDGVFTLIALAGIFCYYNACYHIGIYQFAHDPATHIDNIKYIASSHDWLGKNRYELKNPLFYVAAALLYMLAHAIGTEEWFVVRQLPLFLYLMYLYFAVSALKLTLQSTLIQHLMFAALVLWPIGFTYPVRITPDIGVGMCATGVFYFLLRWHKLGQARDLGLSLVYAALSILFKVLGLVNLPIIAAAVWLAGFRKAPWRSKALWLGLLLNILCIYSTYNNTASLHDRIGFIHTNSHFLTKTSNATLFLTFSLYHYFLLIIDDVAGYPDNMSFWSSFASSFFLGNFPSEMKHVGWHSPITRGLIGLTGLLMLVCGIIFFVQNILNKREHFLNGLIVCAVAMPIAILGLFQMINPGEVYANARELPHFPAFFCVVYGRTLEDYRQGERIKLFYAGIILIVSFIILSLFLFLRRCSIYSV